MAASRAASLFALPWLLLTPGALAAKHPLEVEQAEAEFTDEPAAIFLLQSSRHMSQVKTRATKGDAKLVAGTAHSLDSSSTCGMSQTEVKADCDRPDMGSCGNACCTLEVALSMDHTALYEALADFLKDGGGDGSYSLVPGEMPFNEHPPDDLTSLNISGGWKYVFQGKHTTSGRGYVDTLNFNIRSTSAGTSILRAFSVSDVHGALGDAGQNYKTLAYMLQALGVDPAQAVLLYGCGQPVTAAVSLQASSGAGSAAAAGSSTCGMSGGAADCGKSDMGSCGNACCFLEVATQMAPKELYSTVSGFLRSGGDNSSYALVPGKMPFDEHPADDLTSLGIPGGWQFVFQGHHTTSGRGYIDTLDFNIRTEGGASILRAFSVSDLHGALGDAGQTFKTLAYLLDATGLGRAGAKVLYGCGGP